MQLFVQLTAFVLRQVLGESAASVVGFVQQRFLDQSLALPRAVRKAGERSWHALGVALAGNSLLDRLQRWLGSSDDRGLRDQIQLFLKSQDLQLPGTSDEVRQACLLEWRKVRKSNLFQQQADAGVLARQVADFQRYTDLTGLVEAAQQTMHQIAELLASDYPNLAWLLRQPTPQGPPLLAAAFAYFFRQEVARDDELIHELLLDNLRQLTVAHGKGLVEIGKALTALAENCDRLLDSLEEQGGKIDALSGQVEAAHGAVLDLQATLVQLGGQQQSELAGLRGLVEKVLALLDSTGMPRGEVRPRHSLSIRGEDQRRQVQKLFDQYCQLPAEQQRQSPALLNGLGKLQLGAGDFSAARQSFLEVAGAVADDPARAEACFNAYRAALEEKRWDDALAAITQATIDAQRFAPFPLQRYQPKQILGSGGFGTVFLCYDRNLDENVVVKSLHAVEMERSVLDVFREARLLRQLNHPAIIGGRDGDFADPATQSRPYIVMDYFPGSNLEARLRRGGALSPQDARQIAWQIGRGMQAAHARGILHRDLKPDNVLVRKDARGWEVKIIDFGLALSRQRLEMSRSLAFSEETILGASVAGTLRYAPPEQLGELRRDGRPVPVGPHSDVYSFGKLICHALFLTTEPRHRHWQTSPEHALWQPLLEACLEQELEHRHASFEPVLRWLEEQSGGTAFPGRPESLDGLGRPSYQGVLEDAAASSATTGNGQLATVAERFEEVLQSSGQAHARARQQAEELHDYAAAARTLEALPEHARDPALYLSLCARRDRIARLETEIRQALQVGRTFGLRSRLEALLELQPNRQDLRRLREKLPPEPQAGEVITASHAMRFVWVPAGTFLMGSPPEEVCRSEDERQHRVTLSQGFWLSSQLTTQAQWEAVMQHNPSSFRGPDRPVEQVSWEDCQEFCRRLGEKDGQRYRLPTEAEWEYACRARATTPFAFGETLTSDQANYDANFTYGCGSAGLYREQTTPVHFFKPNRWGLHDMHGNVWEWCQDWYGDYPAGPMRDPQGPETGHVKVVRGGSWSCPPRYCRSAFRFWFASGYRSRYLGFRVVVCLD